MTARLSGLESDPIPYLITITADRIVLVSSAPAVSEAIDPPAAAVTSLRSLGHGQWSSDGAHIAHLAFVRLMSDSAGGYLGQRGTEVHVTAMPSNDEWLGTFTVVARDASGAQKAVGEGKVSAVRVPATIDEGHLDQGTKTGVKP